MKNHSKKSIWVFTPSRTDPKDLEFILVQRHQLLQDAVERIRESALTENKHHLLFVGPRGCGKTHLVTLIVSRLLADPELTDRMRMAWLNEDETCTSLLELLLKIHAALEKSYQGEYRPDMLDAAYGMKPEAALEFISKHLLSTLGSRTLVLVAENLDAIFEGLGPVGQKQLRAFIQENSKLSIVATAQRLVEDLSSRTSPFFGFFQTEHLKPLNVEEATLLLQNLAKIHEMGSVAEFLSTSRGRARVRALHHLSGGNHRIYIVLSQFITLDTIDALVGPFMQMVDELTPYYQERIRWLPPLQRKIVECLCSYEGTMPVKEIAKRLFATPQTISSQLQDLREKGYVEANQRGRESLYEISEPLMRICIEVKDILRHQPLRLLVDFLRVWYDDQELQSRLGKLMPTSTACAYLESAIQRNSAEGNLRKQILLEDLQRSLSEKLDPPDRDSLLQELANQPEAVILAMQSLNEGNKAAAFASLDEALAQENIPSCRADVLLFRAKLHSASGDHGKAIDDYTSVIELPNAPEEQIAKARIYRFVARGRSGERQIEIDDYSAVIGLPGAPVELVAIALVNRGAAHGQSGKRQLAIDDCTAVIGLPGANVELVAMALNNRGVAYAESGARQAAIDDYAAAIGLSGAPVEQVATALNNRGVAYAQSGARQAAIDDYTAVVALPGAPIEQVAIALVNRGITYSQSADTQREIDDYTAVVALPGAPVGQVAMALGRRGVAFLRKGQKQQAQSDFEALIRLPGAPAKLVADSYLALTNIHFADGKWNEGFQDLEAGLEAGETEQPPHYGAPTELIEVVFSAGLGPENRAGKVRDLLAIYGKHQALSALGEAVVQHIGGVFRAGPPFPSTDNLEGWALAWERAAETVPDFRLSVRLLRTAINFVKAGGKDRGILLDLTSTERAILEQAFGLAEDRVLSLDQQNGPSTH
jgi:tetratricopeptide (TPR) repeat protein/DNA-binding transcriptional ArsR family regulator